MAVRAIQFPSLRYCSTFSEEMTETMLAQHTVETLQNISARPQLAPFFLAVGFQ